MNRNRTKERMIFFPSSLEHGCCSCYAKSLQSCPILCDPIDGSPPGSPVPGILQARTLEWVAISFSNSWKWKVKVKLLSCVQLLATPWTAAYQAPPSMGFSRQEYWSRVPLPSPSQNQTNWNTPRSPRQNSHTSRLKWIGCIVLFLIQLNCIVCGPIRALFTPLS